MNDNGHRYPMRVLHCRSSTGRFGPEQAFDQVAPALREQLVEPCLVALYRRPDGGPDVHPWIAAARDAGMRAEQLLDTGPLSLDVVRGLARVVRRSGCDVLHTHDYRSNVLGGLAARRAEHTMPWVATVHLHTQDSRRLRLYRALDLFLLRLADRVVTVSREQRRFLLRRGIERRRLVLVPNVIDVVRFAGAAGDAAATRAALGVPAASPLVGIVGRLTHQKGVDAFLAAAAIVRASSPDARFLVVGSGPLRGSLEREAVRLGLLEAVSFLGYRDDVAAVMAACDVVAMPSRAEGLPLVLLEALALARPVVAVPVGGVREVVRHEQTGLLCDGGDAKELAAAISRLLADPELAGRLGAAGRAYVRRAHVPERAARRLAATYRAVLAERA